MGKYSRDLFFLMCLGYFWAGFALAKDGVEWVEFLGINIGAIGALIIFIIYKYNQLNNTGG